MKNAKPTIVATQMLVSMTDSPEPTRAEVSDVATAAILGTDCVMLSEETANGQYPIEAVSVMKRVILYAQTHMPVSVTYPISLEHNRENAISHAVLELTENIGAKAIIAETLTGATALQITSRRPDVPVIAVTSSSRTAQQLAVVYNVKSYVRPVDARAAGKLTDWLLKENVLQKDDIVVMVSGQTPGVIGTTDTIKVRVLA